MKKNEVKTWLKVKVKNRGVGIICSDYVKEGCVSVAVDWGNENNTYYMSSTTKSIFAIFDWPLGKIRFVRCRPASLTVIGDERTCVNCLTAKSRLDQDANMCIDGKCWSCIDGK